MSIIEKIISEYRKQGLLNEEQLKHLREGLEEIKDLGLATLSDSDMEAFALGYLSTTYNKIGQKN